MKKILTIFILFIALVFPVCADDGSWSKNYRVEGGSIYSETERPDIMLEKELLVFDGYQTYANFLFTNTSDRAVTVTCGFPVRIKIPTSKMGDLLYIPTGKYDRGGEIPGLNYFETTEVDTNSDEMMFYDDRAILINEHNNSRNFLQTSVYPEDISFTITQDKKDVAIDDLLLERHAGEDGAWLTYHYKHDLRFQAGESSVVKVKYRYNMFHGEAGVGESLYRWDYFIGTGRTWKGPIGDFYFVYNTEWGSPGRLDFSTLYADNYIKLMYEKDYEPEKNEQFALTAGKGNLYYFSKMFERIEENNFTDPVYLQKDKQKRPTFITNVNASSALNQIVSVYTPKGRIENADFTADSLFDGYTETAWCEGVPGPGIGEYVEFNLTEKAWGFTVQNGFNRTFFPDEYYRSSDWKNRYRDPDKGLLDYYLLNNRPKVLDIVDNEGKVKYTVHLKDSRVKQVFPGVILRPGRYRLVVKDVYKGTKWDDTCIGEASFVLSETSDEYSKEAFQKMLQDELIMEWLTEVSF